MSQLYDLRVLIENKIKADGLDPSEGKGKLGLRSGKFHTPEPDMTMFLRLHNPAKFGDHLNRLAAVPDKGSVLERFRDGNSVFVRGIFAIHDAAGNTVGAMFVVRDISATYVAMRHTQNILVLLIVVSPALGTVLVLTLLNRLVFRRLKGTIRVATRVVGGDYETEIRVESDDEVGQFEQFFEQFRRVFVDLLAHVPELQEK